MQIINITPFQFACLPGKVNFPKNSLTYIIKGTFDLKPDQAAAISEKQLFPTGDEFYSEDKDMIGGPRYSSDFAYFKPKADLMLVGRFYAPGGKQIHSGIAKFQAGLKTKTINIFGNRFWMQGISGSVSTTPQPFSQLELRYENSFGGENYENNPVGKGINKIENERGERVYPLPNILKSGETISSPGTKLEPAGFGPINQTWKQRFSKLGSYKGNYLEERWPWFPKDFDWSFFNSAPSDMQSNGYLKGDEEVYLENLHPVHPRYHSRLPGLRVRCFIIETDEKKGDLFKEINLNLDTLWVDMDQEKLVLVWRGVSDIKTEEYEEIKYAFVASESTAQNAQSSEYYKSLLEKALNETDEEYAEEEPPGNDSAEDKETEEEIASAEKESREALIKEGIDPDRLPEPNEEQKRKEAELLKEIGYEEEAEPVKMSREIFIERKNRGESFEGEDLTGIDLSGLNLQYVNFKDSILTNVLLKNSDLSYSNLSGAILSGSDLTGSKLNKAVIINADLTGASLVKSELIEAEAEGAVFESAKLNGAFLKGFHGKNTFFTGSDLTGSDLSKSDLTGADFSGSVLSNTDFSGSDLQEVSFEKAEGVAVNFSVTNLAGLKASGCNFSKSSFKKAKGLESIWEKGVLNDSDFSFSEMEGANFSGASLERANLTGSNMKFAKFTKANLSNAAVKEMNLFQGSFEKANLTKADCSKSNFYGVEFLDSKTSETKFQLSNLKMTKLGKKSR
ncbi:MAG TPA: DUF2169 domain-containing protein [Ignavibacteriaceae bacterium]|nr:DUF2169 domain-containing protein [Ignavibacteriaceae bacterium]